MAQEYVLIKTDDLEGGEANDTVRFSLDSKNYVIDLNTANAKALRDALRPYIEKAREDVPAKEAPARGARAKAAPAGRSHDAPTVRAWAREQGYQVSDRGRVQSEILAAYKKAVGG